MQFFQILFALIAISFLANSQTIRMRDDVLFERLGTYTFGHIEKTYWVSRHMKAQWHLTRPICKANGFDIVSINTLDEWAGLAQMCEANKKLFGWFVHVGGVAAIGKSKTDWYWIGTNKEVSYELPWKKGQPDFYGNNEWCLSLSTGDGFKFNDIPCYGSWEERFICESVRNLNVEISAKVGVVTIQELNKNK